jgi:hypothetical protein
MASLSEMKQELLVSKAAPGSFRRGVRQFAEEFGEAQRRTAPKLRRLGMPILGEGGFAQSLATGRAGFKNSHLREVAQGVRGVLRSVR